MHITALAGGVGGARFIRGLRHHLDTTGLGDSTVTVIANTGDDITLFGLRVCPDLDTLLYTLGDGVHECRDVHVRESVSPVRGAASPPETPGWPGKCASITPTGLTWSA